MRKLFGTVAITALAIVAAPANAATIIKSIDAGSDTYSFSRSANYYAGWSQVYRFDIPVADYVDIFVKSVAEPLRDARITSVVWNGHSITQNSSGVLDLWSLNDGHAKAGRNYLQVSGYWGKEGGSYSGTFAYGTAASVPEPASWAMLIAGFGLIGASMRRRNVMKVSYS